MGGVELLAFRCWVLFGGEQRGCVTRRRRAGVGCSAYVRRPSLALPLPCGPGQRPGPSPGTNSPQDCLCPGSVHRSRGPAAELAAFASLSPLRHLRRVSSRFALRARAAGPVLLGASRARCSPSQPTFASHGRPQLVARTDGGSRQAVPSAGAVWGAEQRSLEGGSRSELRHLTCRILFERSERSERSELCGTPSRRAAQGSRRAAPTAPSCARTGHRLPRTGTRLRAAGMPTQDPSTQPSAPQQTNACKR